MAVDAARRFWWAVVLFAVLGAIPGLVVRQGAATLFESSAVLIVAPARDARVQINVTGENERYVLGQIAVLQSGALAERVAAELADGTTGPDLLDQIQLRHTPTTDVVTIAIQAPTGDRAELVANAYADTYLATLSERVDTSASPQVDQIEQELMSIREELDIVDQAIQVEMLPYLAAAADDSSSAGPPTLEQVAPGLVSERQILLSEYLELQTAQTDLRIGAPFVVATEIVERATSAQPAPVGRASLLVVAGIAGGSLAGLFAALILARLSPMLVGRAQVAELTSKPILGSLRRSEEGLPGERERFNERDLATIGAMRAWSEGAESEHNAGAIAVVVITEGASGQGSAAVSTALAASWAADGFKTALVDGDLTARTITATNDSSPKEPTGKVSRQDSWMGKRLVPTGVAGLGIATAPLGQAVWRREQVEELIAGVVEVAEVVVIDAGPSIDSSLAVHAAAMADGVVVVAGSRTRSDVLSLTIDQLGTRNDRVVVVWGEAPSMVRRIRRRFASAMSTASDPASDPGVPRS